jgi:PKD repeat protein
LALIASTTLVWACSEVTTAIQEPPRREAVSPAAPAPSFAISATTPAVLVGAGNIGYCASTNDEKVALLLDGIPGTIFTTGDNIYTDGTAADFENCYAPSWGRASLKARTMPAVGDREYKTVGAFPYFEYFGADAGDPAKGYYSYNLGGWHIVVINDQLDLKANSTEMQWLRADLTANPAVCTAAIWDSPRFYSGGSSGGERVAYEPLWRILDEFGVDLILNGHQRNYERFKPMKYDGTVDLAIGMRQFIIGTGGQTRGSFGTIHPNSELQDKTSYGVLKLTLHADRYDWEFVAVAGSTLTDKGTGGCHEVGASPPPVPPVADAGGPYSTEGPVAFDGGRSKDPGGFTPLTYAWDFGDGSTGKGVRPTHTYAPPGPYTVTLRVTNSVGTVSEPATTTVTIERVAPTVSAGDDRKIAAGRTLDLSASFTDPGQDGPFSFTINWGDGASSTGSVASTSEFVTGSHPYPTAGTFTVTVTVSDVDGDTGGADFLLTVDAVSATTAILLAAGDIAQCGSALARSHATADLMETVIAQNPTVSVRIAPLGDLAYQSGTDEEFANCYTPTWGRSALKGLTIPLPGNHEYNTTGAAGYFKYFGAAAGDPAKGYYSVNVGEWHIVVLNDNIDHKVGTAQEVWLRADLKANPKKCTLAMWHRPRFYSSGSGNRPSMYGLWKALYDAGAELILVSHTHNYERFARLNADGNPDPVRGIRQILVGTGGASQGPQEYKGANVEVQGWGSWGVLKLTLQPDAYHWEFLRATGTAFADAGSEACH